MSVVQVELAGQSSVERAEKLLADINGGVSKAVKSAMVRAVSHLRSNTVNAIRERYAISATNIRANENVKIRYTYQDGVQAWVTFAGQKIPLYRYDGASPKQPTRDTSQWIAAMFDDKWRTIHPSLSAYGHQLKSTSPQHFQDAFVAQMKSGHTGIFERTGSDTPSGNDAIMEIMGSSVPQMLGNQDVEEKLAQDTAEKYDERLNHEILRILNGWGW